MAEENKEQEQCTIQNVIWRCIKPITDMSQKEIFTKGRLYEQVGGWIIDNNGHKTELSIFEEHFTSI